jgi:hypothetical protein
MCSVSACRVALRSWIRAASIGVLSLCMATLQISRATAAGDYPTNEVVDYVLGCMKANGETREALDHCSCAFDVLASLLPYERYVAAETAQRMAQVPGEMGSVFRSNAMTKSVVADLRRAQAEAELRCF